MIHFTYHCPRTGQQVQRRVADDLTIGETYELVNPKSGKVMEAAKASTAS
jgi:hypothetical protein